MILVVFSARGNLLSKQLFIEARKQMVEECRLPVRFLVLVFVCNFFSCCIFCNLLPQIIDTISKKPARHVTAKSCELKTLPALHHSVPGM